MAAASHCAVWGAVESVVLALAPGRLLRGSSACGLPGSSGPHIGVFPRPRGEDWCQLKGREEASLPRPWVGLAGRWGFWIRPSGLWAQQPSVWAGAIPWSARVSRLEEAPALQPRGAGPSARPLVAWVPPAQASRINVNCRGICRCQGPLAVCSV